MSNYYNLEFLFSAFAITTKQSYYYYIKNHLDENLQLILFRLKELDEEFEDPVVEQGMVGDYLVQDSQMDWCMFCAKLEVAGFCHSTLHPPNYTNRHYWVPTWVTIHFILCPLFVINLHLWFLTLILYSLLINKISSRT